MFHIVLVEPEIPQNAGNIARTCAATGTRLHMGRPLGFEVTDKYLKRAGLDYWNLVEIFYYDSFEDFLLENPDGEKYYFTSHTERAYTDICYPEKVYLIFGQETAGLPDEIREPNKNRTVRIPMRPTLRCLNLSNAVAIAVYEVLRQHSFEHLI